jgi:O-antigen biosynthesis protein
MFSDDSKVIASTLDEILSFCGDAFVHHAYIALLGRTPDPEGMLYYRSRLKAGVHKIEILRQLSLSPEGKTYNASISGLQARIRRYNLLKTPFFGTLLTFFGMQSIEGSVQKNIRALDNKIDLQNDLLVSKLNEINNILIHFEKKINQNNNNFFDANWYLEQNPSAVGSGMSPYEHFMVYGKKEGLHPQFDAQWYLSQYSDVADSGMDPRDHYQKYGKKEGRHPAFDGAWYLDQYPDTRTLNIDPFSHYILYGKKEGRHPAYSPYNVDRNIYASWKVDVASVRNGPTISVIMPVYNTPEDMLTAAISSVIEQVYENWELIIVDDKSIDPHVAKIIEKFAKEDKRIKVCFRKENGNISKALNTGISMAIGEFIAVLDHDDTLDKYALYWVVRSILDKPDVDYLYTDEDKISRDGKTCFGPFYKPDWSPEYFLAMMYTCHLGVYRTSIVRDIGGYRTEFDGAQDYDLTLRFLARTNKVFHIPQVLYHWRVWEQSTAQSNEAKPYAEICARRALIEFLESKNEKFFIADEFLPGHHQVKFLPKDNPLVSIVIPTANGSIDINGSIEMHIDAVTKGIFEKTAYPNYELVVVHNGNLLPQQEKSLAARKNLRLVHYDKKIFSLAEKINLGCAHALGEYLVIMNDDIRVISKDWLDQMVGMIQRDGVGAVGPKLLFPNGTIQHAGVVLLGGLPGHVYYEWPKDAAGYAMGAKVDRNYLAVTGACTITPKWLFDKLGGYSSKYPLNYNDVDYCLRLHRLGYRSVYLANVELYHYEGVSKEGGRSVSDAEVQLFLDDWSSIYSSDPYYNINLSQNAPYQFG